MPTIKSKIMKFGCCQEGTVFIEFALLLPLMATFLTFAVDAMMFMHRQAILDDVSRHASRAASLGFIAADRYIHGDDATKSYDSYDVSPTNAVYVSADRSTARNYPTGNAALRSIDQDYFGTGSPSAPLANEAVAVSVEGGVSTCASATIITEDFLNTGGGNTLTRGVCLHGASGVLAAGGDYFGPDVRISAENIDAVALSHTVPGSATAHQVSAESMQKPTILPNLEADFDRLWAGLYESDATHYYGNLLPDNIYKGLDDTSEGAKIVRVNQGWWTVQPGELKPNTIYLVNHGMVLSSGIDAQRVAIIANGQIGIGGGPAPHFMDVFFFGDGQLNFFGDVVWGDPNTYCQGGEYNTYLFSNSSLSLGGLRSSGGAYGVVGAAPVFSPGGALKNSGGLYFEAQHYTNLGGNLKIDGCETALQSHYALSQPEAVVVEVAQIRKVRRLRR